MKNIKSHKNFKLNGNSFDDPKELLGYCKNISSSIHNFLLVWFDNNDTVEVQTSGSTGKPKVIALKKEYMVNSAKTTGTSFNLSENATALLCLSTDFIAGKMMLVRALTLGWHLDIVDASSNPLQNIEKTYDFCAMVPMQVHHSLSELHKIKKLVIGGGVVGNNLLNELQSKSTEIYATYGMTETITHVAIKGLNKSSLHAVKAKQSEFITLPNVKISTNLRGCLVIDAPNISDDIIITNDLVEIISDSEFKWLGRADNVINSGGVKLIPEQIEDKLATIIKQRFFVAGIPDELLGEKLVLIVEGVHKTENLKTQILNLSLLKQFEIPKEIYTIEKFVETDTKKINRSVTLKTIIK